MYGWCWMNALIASTSYSDTLRRARLVTSEIPVISISSQTKMEAFK